MTRRAPNEGSVYQRKDGRWVAQLTYWEGGRRRRRAFYAGTQAEARRRLTAARKAADDGLPLPSERLTVGVFLEQWLEGKRAQLRPESFRRYGDMVRLHLIPELGRTALTRLTPAQG